MHGFFESKTINVAEPFIIEQGNIDNHMTHFLLRNIIKVIFPNAGTWLKNGLKVNTHCFRSF